MNKDIMMFNIRYNHEYYHKQSMFATCENNKDGTLVAYNQKQYYNRTCKRCICKWQDSIILYYTIKEAEGIGKEKSKEDE